MGLLIFWSYHPGEGGNYGAASQLGLILVLPQHDPPHTLHIEWFQCDQYLHILHMAYHIKYKGRAISNPASVQHLAVVLFVIDFYAFVLTRRVKRSSIYPVSITSFNFCNIYITIHRYNKTCCIIRRCSCHMFVLYTHFCSE